MIIESTLALTLHINKDLKSIDKNLFDLQEKFTEKQKIDKETEELFKKLFELLEKEQRFRFNLNDLKKY
jgi:cob(I)alamin adenosyltransferase